MNGINTIILCLCNNVMLRNKLFPTELCHILHAVPCHAMPMFECTTMPSDQRKSSAIERLLIIGSWHSGDYCLKVNLSIYVRPLVHLQPQSGPPAVVQDLNPDQTSMIGRDHALYQSCRWDQRFKMADSRPTRLFVQPRRVIVAIQVLGHSGEKETIWGEFCPILIKSIYVMYSNIFISQYIVWTSLQCVFIYLHYLWW